MLDLNIWAAIQDDFCSSVDSGPQGSAVAKVWTPTEMAAAESRPLLGLNLRALKIFPAL
jgi:hypothetical protein